MTSTLAGQVLDVRAQGLRDPGEDKDRAIAPAALNAAQIGLMHLRAMSQLLLRETALTPKGLNIQADSHPYIHAAMARSDLTSGHRL